MYVCTYIYIYIYIYRFNFQIAVGREEGRPVARLAWLTTASICYE